MKTVYHFALLLISALTFLVQAWVQDVSYPTHFLMDTPAEIIGLKNCTYVFIQLVIYSNRKWKWIMLDRTNNSFWEINATQGNVHIDTFTDHEDELIFTAYDRFTGQRFIQMVDLSQNIHYNYSGFPEMDFAFYNGSEDLYLVHMVYPDYKILRGSLKNQLFSEIYEYPPVLSYTPTKNVKCSEGVCYWLMNEGSLMLYPMSSSFSLNTFHRLFEDGIVLFQFAQKIDGTHLMYTGHTSGLILQWILLSNNTYKPVRLTDAFLDLQISSLTIVGQPGNSYLAATTTTDQQIGIYLQQNKIVSQHNSILTIGARNTTQTWNCPHPPQMAYFKRNVDIYSTLYHVQFTPDDGHVDDPSVNSLFEVSCWSQIKSVEVADGVFKSEEVWHCGVDDGLQGCKLYSVYNGSVCVRCLEGYELVEDACQVIQIVIVPQNNQTNTTQLNNSTNQTSQANSTTNNTVNSTYPSTNTTESLNYTAQTPDSINETNQTQQLNNSEPSNSSQYINQTHNYPNITNQTVSSPDTNYFNDTSSNQPISNQTQSFNQTESLNQTFNNTNSTYTYNLSQNTNSTIIGNQSETATQEEEEEGESTESFENHTSPSLQDQYDNVPQNLIPVLSFMGTISQNLSLPFSYIKNVVQITLLAFILHNLISFWVLASLYYFLPHTTHFLKSLLLLMWKAYNTELLGLFNVQVQLPKLNSIPSDLIYGQITISNDFLEFTFDPMMIMALTAINILLVKVFKVCLKKTCMQRKRLSWIKVDLMDDLSDIFIQLIPILFLPSANFIFSPHFQNPLQKINLILFSSFGAIGLVFPFWYFSLSINKTHSIKKNPKLRKKESIAEKQAYHKLFCNILHITIPITVLLSNTWIFLIFNAIFILLSFISAFHLQQEKLNHIIHRFYYLIFHTGFCIMHYFQDGEQFIIAASVSFFTIFVYLLHEVLEFVYRVGLFLYRFQRDCTEENKVSNLDNEQESKTINGHPLAKIEVNEDEIIIGSAKFVSYNEFCKKEEKKMMFEDQEQSQNNHGQTMLPLNKVLTSILQERRKKIHQKFHKTSPHQSSHLPKTKLNKIKRDRSEMHNANNLKIEQPPSPPEIINPEDILVTTYISKQ